MTEPSPDQLRPLLDRVAIATGNPYKVRELESIFAAIGVEVVSLADLPSAPFEEPIEDGDTFEANATIKAISYARQTGLPCMADDSGLMVDALAGAPGVISSHYATDGREFGHSREERDAANNARLLKELEGVAPEERTAQFVCVMVLAVPGADQPAVMATSRGEFVGRIGMPGDVPRGSNGFGYDPLFLVGPDFMRTGAELPTAEKNAISHRAKAAMAMAEKLRALRQ